MPLQEVSPKNTLFVLGAGVDVALGLPTMHNLLHELARFTSDEGKEVEAAIRKHVKRMQFNLRKMAGEQRRTIRCYYFFYYQNTF